MEIPQNITSDHLLKAFEKIDAEGIPNDGDSRYYDVIHNEKRYPPKVVVAFANLFANGQILDRSKFRGGEDTECFKLLESNGFRIVEKNNKLIEKIKLFTDSYKQEVQLRHSKNLTSFNLLVNEIPKEIKAITSGTGIDLIVKGSIGAGVNTFYPWVGIFNPKVSTGAQNGFYVVILFSDDFEDLYLTLNQGSTLQSKEQTKAYRNFVYSVYDSIDGFEKGRIPAGGLVKTKTGSATNNGKKYEETNIFFKRYEVSSLNEKDFLFNLKKIVGVYIECASKYLEKGNVVDKALLNNEAMNFNFKEFYKDINESGLLLDENKVIRFIASLLCKPFVILTGLSGSGKTKLAQAFALWICENERQYCIVPVGADWTNREPLLGFPNGLIQNDYKTDEYGLLKLIIEANKNSDRPYFLILDEMNLSHVERYFADFLSVMESKTKISLHSGNEEWNGIPPEISFPKNLFIIGTVNIDETTYMFSPKVLDRANVIEFRVTVEEMHSYLHGNLKVDLNIIEGKGASMAEKFVDISRGEDFEIEGSDEMIKVLLSFFSELKKTGAEFGYRSASEILRFGALVNKIEPTWTTGDIIDVAIVQKLLPKVHGSIRKLEPILKSLGTFCLAEGLTFDDILTEKTEIDKNKIKYPIALEKIHRMYNNLISNGFTSYAEA